MICQQCKTYIKNEEEEKKIINNTWPGFIWHILSSSSIHKLYENYFIWKLIPLQWREWWYDEVIYQFLTYFGNITKNHPPSVFIDWTYKINDWKDLNATYQIVSIANACNKCRVSSFIHKIGYSDLDIAFQHYLQAVCF